MAGKGKSLITFEMWYLEKGVVFFVEIPYSARNWWAVLGLRNSRNIKRVRKTA